MAPALVQRLEHRVQQVLGVALAPAELDGAIAPLALAAGSRSEEPLNLLGSWSVTLDRDEAAVAKQDA